MFNLFKTKAEKVAKAQDSYNPPASTGFLADPKELLSSIEDLPLVSFNGTRSKSFYNAVESEDVGNILKVRDPKSPQALTILNPRVAEHLGSSASGKVSITGSTGQEYTLLDVINPGGHIDLPVVIGQARFATVTPSTVKTSSESSPTEETSDQTIKDSVVKKTDNPTNTVEGLKKNLINSMFIKEIDLSTGIITNVRPPTEGIAGNNRVTGTSVYSATSTKSIGK